MPSKDLYAAVTNTSGIVSINIDQDFGQPTATAMIEATTTSLGLGDAITVDLGYTDAHQQVFSGYVLEDAIKRTQEGVTHTLRCRDNLWRAMAYFIAAEDPLVPLEYSWIDAEDLVRAMLDICGITSYSLDSPGFTFAVEEPLEVQLTSCWDMISRICQLIAWHCYDNNGTIRFLDRKPYPVGGDSPVASLVVGSSGQLIGVEPYSRSSDKIRNKVVVYGAEGIASTASAVSPYLPAGFYQTEVISAPDLIDTQAMADDIANYNLDLLNRLDKTLTINIAGLASLKARQVVTVTETNTGVSGDWFIYSCRHQFKDTFTTNLTLTQRET